MGGFASSGDQRLRTGDGHLTSKEIALYGRGSVMRSRSPRRTNKVCYINSVTTEFPRRILGKTAARLARSVDLALATVEITAAQYRMLQQLAEGSEASTSLARKLAVTAPSVTAVVDGLVQRGLVDRFHSEEDRRRVSLELTADGREVLVAADNAVEERLLFIASFLGDEGRTKEALEGLELWGEALDAYRAHRLALSNQAEPAVAQPV